MSQEKIIWFQSKVDWWLGVIMVLLPLIFLAILISGLVMGNSTVIAAGIISSGLVGALYWFLIFPLRYGISSEELIIRHGVIRQRARLDAIKGVKPTRNPISSPALSLDRLEVRTGPEYFSTIYISPVDREGFLTALSACSGLVRDGSQLTRQKG